MIAVVTGGAGFIGSHLVGSLLQNSELQQVIVLDNLSTGSLDNVSRYRSSEKYRFILQDLAKEGEWMSLEGRCHFSLCGGS